MFNSEYIPLNINIIMKKIQNFKKIFLKIINLFKIHLKVRV